MPLNLEPVQSGYNLSVINENFQRIEDTWDEKLDRLVSTQANYMEQELDMNSNHIINHPAPRNELDLVRLKELEQLVIDSDVVGVIPLQQPRQVGDGVTTDFSAPNSKDVSPVTMMVRIDGVQQRAFTDFEVLGVGMIRFNEAPPLNADIDILYFEPNVVENPDVSLRTAKSTGSTESRTLADRFATVVDVKDFGAVGDGVADDTQALRDAIAELSNRGGGTLLQTCDLYISVSPTETLWDATDHNYVSWQGNGFTVYDQTSYLDGEISILIFTKNVKSIDVDLNLVTQQSILPGEANPVPQLGMQGIRIEDGCEGGRVKVNQYGGYSACNISVTSGAALPPDNDASGFRVDIKTDFTHYPFRATFNGININGTLRTANSGRPFYLYDAHNIDLDVYTKNVFKTGLIVAFEGKGCSNIKMRMTDVDSDFPTPSSAYCAIRYGDITPAVIENIDLTFNVVSTLAGGYDFGFEIGKYNNVAPDPVGRGHRLENITIRGQFDLDAPNGIPVTSVGDWEEGVDVQRNICVDGLRCVGQSSTLNLHALRNSAFIRGVDARAGLDNFYVESNENSNVTFIGCRAAQFYKANTLNYKQTFIDCEMTLTNASQVRTNKTLINTILPDGLADSYYRNGAGVVRNKVQYKGSLATPLELTSLPKGQYQITVNYYVVRDRADTNPATRDESLGVYTCSVVIGSDGSFNAIQDWNQDSHRTIGTPPALVFTGVDVGAESSIRVSSAAYNTSNTTSVFEIAVKDNDLEATLL